MNDIVCHEIGSATARAVAFLNEGGSLVAMDSSLGWARLAECMARLPEGTRFIAHSCTSDGPDEFLVEADWYLAQDYVRYVQDNPLGEWTYRNVTMPAVSVVALVRDFDPEALASESLLRHGPFFQVDVEGVLCIPAVMGEAMAVVDPAYYAELGQVMPSLN